MNTENKLLGDFNGRSEKEHLIQTLEFLSEEGT